MTSQHHHLYKLAYVVWARTERWSHIPGSIYGFGGSLVTCSCMFYGFCILHTKCGWLAGLQYCFVLHECYCFITRNVSSLFCATQSETCNISPREEFLSLIQLGNLNFSISLTGVLYCFVLSCIILLHNSCVHITAKYNNNM